MLRRVVVENGILEGLPAADPRITVFKGIPFAAPPVGELRWRPPQPCKDWRGVYKAYTFAPISIQATPGLDPNNIYTKEWHVDPNVPMSEDCLYLNVWTPAKHPDEKLPVMVWIFGGGLQVGYTSEMEFDGERIARRGIVFVSVNYRLNVFGFFAHPQISAENPNGPKANFGLLDQLAGIAWVKRNIATFGGNPDNITIFGQSAGGGSVTAHITSPVSKGMFQKAIIQSGGGFAPRFNQGYPSLEEAEKIGEEFFEYLGVSSLDEARKLDAKELFEKSISFKPKKLDAKELSEKSVSFELKWGFVKEEYYIVDDPVKLILKGQWHKIPLIIGHTGDEFMEMPNAKTLEEFKDYAYRRYQEDAEEYLELCKVEGNNIEDMCKKGTVNMFEIGNLMWCEHNAETKDTTIYCYCFDPEIPGDNAGAFHSSELWFVFETLAKCWRPFTGKHYDLARQMCNYWTNFAKKGNPNGLDVDGTFMPEWRPYTKEESFIMLFGDKVGKDLNRPTELMKLMVRHYFKQLKTN